MWLPGGCIVVRPLSAPEARNLLKMIDGSGGGGDGGSGRSMSNSRGADLEQAGAQMGGASGEACNGAPIKAGGRSFIFSIHAAKCGHSARQ